MRALQIVNATILALTATFAMTLGVVAVMYSFYLDSAPRMREEWRAVVDITLVFSVLTLFAAAAFWGHHRQARWRWPAEAVMAAALLVGTLRLLQVLR